LYGAFYSWLAAGGILLWGDAGRPFRLLRYDLLLQIGPSVSDHERLGVVFPRRRKAERNVRAAIVSVFRLPFPLGDHLPCRPMGPLVREDQLGPSPRRATLACQAVIAARRSRGLASRSGPRPEGTGTPACRNNSNRAASDSQTTQLSSPPEGARNGAGLLKSLVRG
jgi:hypothetical protein